MSDDDPEEDDDQGREDITVLSSINSINISPSNFTPSHDVIEDTEDLHVSSVQLGEGKHDPDAIRAQIDTGAFATCTDQLKMLHSYKAFTVEHPSPVRLLPATENSDAVPQGYGYLHVPAHNTQGFLAVRAFYHPKLRTTVIDERDLVKAAGHKVKDVASERIEKHYEAGTFTYRAKHKLKTTNDVVLHGVLMSGKCYTHALIPPDLPHGESLSASAKCAEDDPDFAEECHRATLLAIHTYQESEYSRLREELTTVPVSLHSLPFHEYAQQNTPVDFIKATTERMLWHHRLGHPSDYYLYNAHKHVKGVPKFAHMDRVLDICPTCIRAKQKKEPAGPNTTRTATQPYQGLSIDFSFAGTRSKNTFNRYPPGTRVRKQFQKKMYSGTVISGPTMVNNQKGDEEESWKVQYDDGDTEDLSDLELRKILVNKPLNMDTQISSRR